MKKILLMAVTALMVGTANAQLQKKQNVGKPQTKQQVAIAKKATFKNYKVAGEKLGVKAIDKESKTFKGTINAKDIKPAFNQFKANRAGAVQEMYEGSGTLRSTNEATEWEMYTGTAQTQSGTVNVIKDLIPNIFGFESGVLAAYTIDGGNIVIQPTLVASFPSEQAPSGTYYLFLESATSNDGSITLTLDDTGAITGSYDIIYSVYPNQVYNYDEWVATYDGIKGAQYNIPGVIKVPNASFETGNLVLFAGLGLNGYSFQSNLAMTGAYSTTNFINRTSDKTTGWEWAAYDATAEEPTVYASGTDTDFSVAFEGNTVLQNVTLVGINQTAQSDPFIFGVGKSKNEDGSNHYENCYIYGSNTESSFDLEGTTAIMTRQDPDGDLTFYTNWGTPDKASNPMSKIYIYHEKPAAPLYITGITLPMVNFTSQEDFNLHIKIVKCSFASANSKPTLGEVIAEGDATKENINASFDVGLTAVEIPLYKTDEDGMSEELDHLFLDDEFIIVIEGWDNGTFSGVLGSQDAPLDNARTSTWFEMQGEEGSMYAYTQWKTSLFVGLLGATYGYLYTTDDTHMVIPEAGGQVSIHVHPMFSYSDAAVEELGYKTRLWLDETVAGNEIPEWLQLGWANEDYEDTFTFDLVAQADALPAGVEGREATIVLYQEGAQLTITVTQGKSTGINVTTKTVKTSNTPMFNLAGQRVNKDFKGLIVKDGRKMINK